MRTKVAAAVLLVAAAVTAQNLPSNYEADTWGVNACTDTTDTGCCCSNSLRDNGGTTCNQTELLLCEITKIKTANTADTDAKSTEFKKHADRIWIVTCGALVFFMQCGFAMLEAGSVRTRNTQNIIFKNLVDICIAALGFFSLGFGFAYADGTKDGDAGRFIGTNNFFLMKESNDETGQHLWFFQFAFTATAATIVSGSVAERTRLSAYFAYSVMISTFIYPVVVHWVWSQNGWLSAFAADDRIKPNGMIDYAGSGVVHTVGGWAGLCGAYIVGPRTGRFEEHKDKDGVVTYGKPTQMRGQSTMLASLGVLILWFGWYGFNCGSTLAFDGENAGKVATTTTLAAALGGFTATMLSRVVEGHFAVDVGLNGILAGLVSITAGCSVVDEYPACAIGTIGAILYVLAAKLLLFAKIDDPLGAWPVHGACGVWGCLAVGIWGTETNILRAYGSGLDATAVNDGRQFAVQLLGVTAIVGWTVGCCFTLFWLVDKTVGMRVTAEEEEKGADVYEHGADPTVTWQMRHAGASAEMAATMVSRASVDEWRPPAEMQK